MNGLFEIIELIVGDDLISGIGSISLVDEGAIERNFVHFNKEHIIKLAIHDEEKRMVMGPVLVPNKMILRVYDEPNKERQYFYIHFSPKTVRKAAQRFIEMGNQKNATYQHAIEVEGVTFIESWVKEDLKLDKSSLFGYEDMPIGTWMVIARIDNDQMWEDVKAGIIKGFSIEGKFADAVLKQSKEEIITEKIEEITEEENNMLQELVEILKKLSDENETLK